MMISLFFFFINEIYNIEYYIYIKSTDNSINIKINEIDYEFHKCRVGGFNYFFFTRNGTEEDKIIIESKTPPDIQKNIEGIYIEIEKNCILEIPSNDLINFEPSNRLLSEEDKCISSKEIVYKNKIFNGNYWTINFTLHKVPNNCSKDASLIYLTSDFIDKLQHQYDQPLSIELNQILKMKNNDSENYKEYTLFLNNVGSDENFKLYDQDGKELFLDTPIQFRILTIEPLGEYHSHRKIEINFYTINEKKQPISTLSTISFKLCAYGCKCYSPSDIGKNPCDCLEKFCTF